MFSILKKMKNLGPGLLITAAFIGPGTITTCSLSGASFGYSILWGITFSIIATYILQEMTIRLGIIGKQSLGEALRKQFQSKLARFISIFLVIAAIVIGNAAYETGNILGASLGLIEITNISKININHFEINFWGPVIGLFAFILLQLGSYKTIEKAITVLVIIMSLSFITTAIVIGPDFFSTIKGMLIPKVPDHSLFMIIGLIGTTVVPYNLFLHASTVKEKWESSKDLPVAKTDLLFSVILGGLISFSIVITSATAFYGTTTNITGASDLASQLKPLLGNWSSIFMSVGLFAAGISSAITAPLAAAYATTGVLNLKSDFSSFWFRFTWKTILLIGILFSAVGFSPLKVIVFAQFTNGLLLPLIGIFLLIVMNSKKLLGNYRNKTFQNILGYIVILITAFLGANSILHALGIL